MIFLLLSRISHRPLRFLFLLTTAPLSAQLPSNYQLEHDWLLDPTSYKSQITTDQSAQTITLTNGLISRTIDTRLGTTVNYTNLMTGESIIRAVEPEGSVTLDGETYLLGGVKKQHNKSFFTNEWIKGMKPAANALKLVHFEIGKPKERLQWKRVRHHAPNTVWPPKGKYLRVDYQLTSENFRKLTGQSLLPSPDGRKLLFSDSFTTLDTGKTAWTIHATKAHPRANFSNEGKPGEIYTPANTSVFAERPLPAGTRLIETEIHVGTDTSTSWGPGMALVFNNGKVVKWHVRPGGLSGVIRPVLGSFDARGEHPNLSGKEKINTSEIITLRIRIENDGQLLLDAKQEGQIWKNYATTKIPDNWGAPVRLRVGKLGKDGTLTDFKDIGKIVRLRINRVAIYSAQSSRTNMSVSDLAQLKKLTISAHYEIYDGIPLISKWITVKNDTGKSINLDRFNAETLSVVEYESPVEVRKNAPRPPRVLHLETDMAFGGMSSRNANGHTIHWKTDPSFKTQVNWAKQTPCLLHVEPTFGPDQTILDGKTFESFHLFELVQDSDNRERCALAQKRMYRTIAPWITENPLMLHCKSSNEKVIKTAIDQAAETGFEMVILSFGSGFNSENDSPTYLAKWNKLNDYALSKGIHLGSYSLYSSRSVGHGNDIVPPKGMKVIHGRCPAITSEWGKQYIKKLYNLFDKTGFMVFENDGTYPGSVDVTARPPLQKGAKDSRWVHWRIWTDFYKHLRSQGVFLNLPDYYYLSGSNKCGMGYREVNWSLPRAEQRVITRQNIYDGTWEKTPSMGWMFVPLSQYHGGGAAATIEPLQKHLPHYRMMMLSNLGLGVQAAYRGTRLYDTDETKQMVSQTVAWFKKHRRILESDLIHGHRADGRNIDWMLHVDPAKDAKEHALLSAYNPTNREITQTIKVPLYYAGLQGSVQCAINDNAPTAVTLDTSARATITLTIPAQGYTSVIFK
jgi:hypothetical protein